MAGVMNDDEHDDQTPTSPFLSVGKVNLVVVRVGLVDIDRTGGEGND
jgi:hypothetical protein